MALITLGSGITSIRGKIGGTVYQGSASGTISKNRGYRTNKSSYQSDKAKNTLATLAQYWQTMSDTDRATWNSYAIFKPTLQNNGTGRFLNGQQIFLYYAYRYFNQFASIPSPPSFSSGSLTPNNYYLQNDSGIFNLNIDTPIDEATVFLYSKFSNSVPVGRAYANGGVKSIKSTFANSTTFDLTAPYISLFGRIPVVGEYVIIEVQNVSVNFAYWSNISRLKIQVTS